VAGDPDILLVPDLEAGNMLAKQLAFSPTRTAPAWSSARESRSS
jgi:phosphotransacetylase